MSEYGEHFIREIEIKNYKLFKDFKAEGFGRVNLIGGKNNVGKTAFMEACFLYQSKDSIDLFGKLLEVKTHRNIINNLLLNTARENDLQKIIKNNIGINIGTTKQNMTMVVEEHQGEEYQEASEWIDGNIKIIFDKQFLEIYTKYTKIDLFPVLDKHGEAHFTSDCDKYTISELVNLLDISFDDTKYKFSLNFVSPYSNSNKEIENLIGESKLNGNYEILNRYLNEIFKINKIDIIKNKPLIQVNNEWLELSQFGQGLKSFINIVGSILLLENNIIFIDEIENGIHYTNFDKLWEIILTISKEQNVQVFATTHSKECIESYARVAKKLRDEEITYSILTKLKSGELHHSLYDYSLLENAIIEQGHEVR